MEDKKRVESPKDYDRWNGKVGIEEITTKKGGDKDETSTN